MGPSYVHKEQVRAESEYQVCRCYRADLQEHGFGWLQQAFPFSARASTDVERVKSLQICILMVTNYYYTLQWLVPGAGALSRG
jgi:hypothetical protein